MQANKENINKLLKIAGGQISGVMKMIEEDRYCIDISNQLLATISILQKANFEVLNSHMRCCLKNEDDFEGKINELSSIIQKMMK